LVGAGYKKDLDTHVNSLLDSNIYKDVRDKVVEGDIEGAMRLKSRTSFSCFINYYVFLDDRPPLRLHRVPVLLLLYSPVHPHDIGGISSFIH